MNERGESTIEFNSIVEGLRDEERDPLVTDLLERILELELSMNLSKRVSDKRKGEIENVLYDEFSAAGLLQSSVVVTGRIRPTDFSGFEDGFVEDGNTPESYKDFGPMLTDEYGPYYYVSQKTLFCGSCEVKTTTTEYDSEIESDKHSIYIFLNLMDEDDPDDGAFYVYPEDLEAFAPTEASDQRVIKIMHDRYPAIAAQLDTLPDNCGSDNKIFDALHAFKLEVDMKALRHIEGDEAAMLIEYIERYITIRLGLDISMYQLLVNGDVFALNIRGKPFTQTFDENRNIVGFLGSVVLRQETAQVDDHAALARYSMMIELYAASSERGGAYNLITLPLTSILRAKNMRNRPLFSQLLEEFDEPHGDPGIALINTGEVFDEDEGPEFTVDTYSEEVVPTREQQLAGVKQRLSELFEQVDVYTSKTYDSLEKAKEAAEKIGEILLHFDTLYPYESGILLELEGEGIIYMPLTVNLNKGNLEPEDGPVQPVFDGGVIEQGHLFTVKRGYLQRDYKVNILKIEDDTESYEITVWLIVIDTDVDRSLTFGTDLFSSPLAELSIARQIGVRLDNNLSRIHVREYERLLRSRESIARIAMRLPELEKLPQLLEAFQTSMIEADVRIMKDYNNIDAITAIGYFVRENEAATNMTVDVLNDIVEGHILHVSGPMYTGEGEYVKNNELFGTVKAVISTTNFIPVEEPMLMLIDNDPDDQDIWYVPIASLESISY